MKPKIASLIGIIAVFLLSTLGCGPIHRPPDTASPSTNGSAISPRWGYLAKSGSPVPIKGVYFFTGDAKPDNQALYTFTPVDGLTHLRWTSDANARKSVVDMMGSVGINVITMSYWGDDIGSAPMQSTEQAGDLLFDEAALHNIPVLPAVEVASGLPNHYAQ